MSKWLSLLIFVSSLFITAFPVVAVASPGGNNIIINEIRLGGTAITLGENQTVQEYVTLFNNSENVVSLDGWVLEYAKNPKAGLDAGFCTGADWKNFANITVASVSLAGEMSSFGVSEAINMQLNDTGSGSLRLVDRSDPNLAVVHDVVGWGEDAPCYEKTRLGVPTSGKSLARFVACVDSLPIDTNDNANDFTLLASPVPGKLSGVPKGTCITSPIETDCDKVVISEILPNPSGVDEGREFVEIHNPTAERVSLKGCLMGLVSENKTYAFNENEFLEPNQYRAFYGSVTNLTLPNSAGGEVMLISGNAEEFVFNYPSDLKDDISWAYIGGEWQETNIPTPGEQNKPFLTIVEVKSANVDQFEPCPEGKERNPETNRCKNIETSNSLVSCKIGQERNPETNRCRSIISEIASLTPCKPGQERNPETNRCKSIINIANSLTPCKADQERNPETNRCRKIATDTSSQKPCKEGYERNTETNRCRKIQATLASATDINKNNNSNKGLINYGLLGLAGMIAIGYGIYEYRNDFRYKISAFRDQIFKK